MLPPTPSYGPGLQKLSIVFLVLCTIVAALRVWVRFGIQKAFYLEDWLIAVSLMCFYAYIGVQYHNVNSGYGKHIMALPSFQRVSYIIELWYIGLFIFTVSMCFLRLSILALLVRVIPKNSVPYATATRATLYTIAFFNIIWTLVTICYLSLACNPTSFYWTRWSSDSPGYCRVTKYKNRFAMEVYSLVSGVEDLLVALVPGIVVWQLNISKRYRFVVHGLMVLGCIGGIPNCIRFRYIRAALQAADSLHDAMPFNTWATIEVGIGFIAANLATLRPLVQQLASYMPAWPSRRSQSIPLDPIAPPTFGASRHKRMEPNHNTPSTSLTELSRIPSTSHSITV